MLYYFLGDVILREEPYAAVLESIFRVNHCAHCLRKTPTPIPCYECATVSYLFLFFVKILVKYFFRKRPQSHFFSTKVRFRPTLQNLGLEAFFNEHFCIVFTDDAPLSHKIQAKSGSIFQTHCLPPCCHRQQLLLVH